MTSPTTHQKGRSGEDAAVEYLVSRGYTIVCRNYRTRSGELDCVAEDPSGTLVFVEVKAAQSMARGHPFFWVTRGKQRKIARMAAWYLAEHDIAERACRFDVIAVVGGKVEHMKNAFMAG